MKEKKEESEREEDEEAEEEEQKETEASLEDKVNHPDRMETKAGTVCYTLKRVCVDCVRKVQAQSTTLRVSVRLSPLSCLSPNTSFS